MIPATGNTKVDIPSTTNTADQTPTPHKTPQQGSVTPRLGNKTPMSVERTKTGMAKKLEISFVDESVRQCLTSVHPVPSGTDANADTAKDNLAVSSPVRRKFVKKQESDTIRKSMISSPSHTAYAESDSSQASILSKVPVLKMPDTETSSFALSPIRLSSPRKVTRALSDKLSSIRKTIDTFSSPRKELQDIFEGVEWEDLSDITDLPAPKSTQPLLSPSYLPPQGRKRKAEDDPEKGSPKRVRFGEAPSIKHVAADPAPAPVMQASSTALLEIDRLSRELALSPIKSLTKPDLTETETQAAEQLAASQLQSPIHLRLPKAATTAAQQSGDREEAGFPFTPNLLGLHAIKARQQGKPWIGKASGSSVAGRLQGMLDQVMQANPQTIHLNACVLLQQLFALLPAGANKVNKTFNYAVSASFYSLGFTAEQWKDIETLYRDFDTLKLATLPDQGAEFKAQLKEIIAAKNGLLYLKQQAEAASVHNTEV
jgi:hypothetical protein